MVSRRQGRYRPWREEAGHPCFGPVLTAHSPALDPTCQISLSNGLPSDGLMQLNAPPGQLFRPVTVTHKTPGHSVKVPAFTTGAQIHGSTAKQYVGRGRKQPGPVADPVVGRPGSQRCHAQRQGTGAGPRDTRVPATVGAGLEGPRWRQPGSRRLGGRTPVPRKAVVIARADGP